MHTRYTAALLSACVLSTMLRPETAVAHQPTAEVLRAVHLRSDQIPVIDGDLQDWAEIAPALHMSDFSDLVAGAVADPANLDVRVWLGWNDTENRLYLAVEVADDNHQVDRPEGTSTTRIFQDDDLEIFVDADHSGGQFADFSDLTPEQQLSRNGSEANHFVLAGPHSDGEEFVNFSAAGWYAMEDGPYTQARVTYDGTPGGVGVTRYEMSLVPFDRINVTADFLSSAHDLQAGEIIGFNMELSDFDSNAEFFDAKWSLSGAFNAFRLSERFTDLLLAPPARTTLVEDVSWARIKASFRP
jgi:hypothetical protein